MLLKKEEILDFLPHREPFLFLDSLESIEMEDGTFLKSDDVLDWDKALGATITGNFFVRENLEVLRGHFPGNPILPGVVQIEMMGQNAAMVLALNPARKESAEFHVALVKADNAKFRRPVLPGESLVIKSKCTRARKSMMSYDCTIYSGDEICSQAEILASWGIK